MLKQVTDMQTWLLDNGDRPFRFLVYKKMFTPYEQQKAFCDESQFESDEYNYAHIVEAVDLGNGEWLLGLKLFFDDTDDDDPAIIEYYKLSEIRLSYFERDEETEGE